MSTTEKQDEDVAAAASLFGSADSASDPFSFADVASPKEPEPHTEHFAASDPVAELFGQQEGHAAHQEDLFSGSGEFPATQEHEAAGYEAPADYSGYTAAYQPSGETFASGGDQTEHTEDWEQQGYWDEHGNWQWYEIAGQASHETEWTAAQPHQFAGERAPPASTRVYQPNPAAAAGLSPQYNSYQPLPTTTPVTTYTPQIAVAVPLPPTFAETPGVEPTQAPATSSCSTGLASSAYSAYAPAPSAYTPAAAPSPYAPPPASHTPTAAPSPYAPPPQSTYSQAAVPASTVPQRQSQSAIYAPAAASETYDPYKPTETSKLPPGPAPKPAVRHVRSSSSYGYGVYDQPPPPVKAAPEKKSSVQSAMTVKKTPNAYDPPLPPSRFTPRRREFGLVSPTSSAGMKGPELYPAGGAPISSPPPPPPGPPRRPVSQVGPPPFPAATTPISHPGPPSPQGFSFYAEPPPFEPAAAFDSFEMDKPPQSTPFLEQNGFAEEDPSIERLNQNFDSHEDGESHAWPSTEPIFSPEEEPNWGYPAAPYPALHEETSELPGQVESEVKSKNGTEDIKHGEEGVPEEPVISGEHAHEDQKRNSFEAPPDLPADASQNYGFDDIPTFGDAKAAEYDYGSFDAFAGEPSLPPIAEAAVSDSGEGSDAGGKVQPEPYQPYEPYRPQWGTSHDTHGDSNGATTGTFESSLFTDEPLEDTRPGSVGASEPAPNTGSVYDPYAPAPRSRAPSGPAGTHFTIPPPPAADLSIPESRSGDLSDYGGAYTSRLNYNGATHDPYHPTTGLAQSSSMPSVYAGEGDVSQAPSLYAPSTSRFGTDDPLGRTTSSAPIISFGLGGKLLTCFTTPSSSMPGLVKPGARAVYIRLLHNVIPASALESSTTPFPGPLLGDPSSTSLTGFSRTSTTTGAKSKKASVIKYLEDRAAEIEGGLAYLAAGPEHEADRRAAEGKLMLVKLLKVLVEHDGKLSGSPAIDNAVRSVLVPSAGDVPVPTPESNTLAAPSMFGMNFGSGKHPIAPAPTDGLMSPFLGGSAQPESSEEPLLTYNVRPSALNRLQLLLLRGQRREAVHFALDEKMWAHALVISSSIDKDAWKEAVSEFLRYELTNQKGDPSRRESLRVAYSLFAGNGAAAVQEILPPKSLLKTNGLNGLLSPAPPTTHITPMSPNFPQPALASNIPTESLETWREAAATILSNPSTGNSAALTQLGDYLIMNNWVEAAHVCYLLSPQTSPLGAAGAQSVRMVLLGSGNPNKVLNFHRDLDCVRLTEVLEFAYSLAPVAKGQEPFIGLPHLQPYRLLHALQLAEMGHTALATRYIEAIQQTIKLGGGRAAQLYAQPFLSQMKDLQDRLTQAPQEAVGFWANKVPKPTLDGFGSWVGTNLTKFIAGEGESATQNDASEAKGGGAEQGPFSQYSAISSGVPSTDPSPYGSSANLVGQSITPPARRTGSAMSMRYGPPQPLAAPIDRSASAMDRPRPRNDSPPRLYSADAVTSSFQQAGQPSISTFIPQPPPPSDSQGGGGGWWNASSLDEQTPTTDTYQPAAASTEPASGGGEFISLMDEVGPPSFGTSQNNTSRGGAAFEDDEEDLGFGNSKPKPKTAEAEAAEKEREAKAAEEKKAAAAEEEKKPTRRSSTWFSGWFGGGAKKEAEQSGGPVKANLGEQNHFYYDKELKRWVNKAAGSSTEAAKPATPPPRAQTASPGGARPSRFSQDAGSSSLPTSPSANGTSRPPPPGAAGGPPRAMSAVPPRMRSSLAESFTPSSASEESSTPTATSTPPPPGGMSGPPSSGPPSRPQSRAVSGKKNVRSRYVDVFKDQQ